MAMSHQLLKAFSAFNFAISDVAFRGREDFPNFVFCVSNLKFEEFRVMAFAHFVQSTGAL